MNIARLKKTLGVEPNEKLPTYAWPGSYQIIYFDYGDPEKKENK